VTEVLLSAPFRCVIGLMSLVEFAEIGHAMPMDQSCDYLLGQIAGRAVLTAMLAVVGY